MDHALIGRGCMMALGVLTGVFVAVDFDEFALMFFWHGMTPFCWRA
jgi:hypothetical protein